MSFTRGRKTEDRVELPVEQSPNKPTAASAPKKTFDTYREQLRDRQQRPYYCKASIYADQDSNIWALVKLYEGVETAAGHRDSVSSGSIYGMRSMEELEDGILKWAQAEKFKHLTKSSLDSFTKTL